MIRGVALAEGMAGSEENFAEMMNEKLKKLECTLQILPIRRINDPDNISTVRDTA